jgi:hypothetical protein
VLDTPSVLDKLVVVHLPLTSVEVGHQPCTALLQRMAVAAVAVQLQTGLLDMRPVVDVRRFDLKAHQQMSSLQVVAVVPGLPRTQ